jgi:hypothetical protein
MDIQRVLLRRGEERRRREAMSAVDTNRKSATQIIKEMLEQGKTDDEIVKWITENLPHVKNPKAYLRAAKSYIRKKATQQAAEKAESGSAATPLSTLGIQVQQVEIPRPKAGKVEKEVKGVEETEETEEEVQPIEIDEDMLASLYKGIIEIIGVVAVGPEFAFPEAKARSRARLLKKIIEKHNLGELPWEEMAMLGALAEDAMYVFHKAREKKAKENVKSALGQKVEEKKEEKAEEKKEEQQQVKPDVRDLREKLKQIYAKAGI